MSEEPGLVNLPHEIKRLVKMGIYGLYANLDETSDARFILVKQDIATVLISESGNILGQGKPVSQMKIGRPITLSSFKLHRRDE